MKTFFVIAILIASCLSISFVIMFHLKKSNIYLLLALIFGAIGFWGIYVLKIINFKVDADPSYKLSYYIAYTSTILYDFFFFIGGAVSLFCIPYAIRRLKSVSTPNKPPTTAPK